MTKGHDGRRIKRTVERGWKISIRKKGRFSQAVDRQ